MSSRQRRLLENQHGFPAVPLDEQEAEGESDAGGGGGVSNPYELLQQSEEESNSDKDVEEENGHKEEMEKMKERITEQKTKTKLKTKKRRKKKNKGQSPEDDVDRLVREINSPTNQKAEDEAEEISIAGNQTTARDSNASNLFRIRLKSLRGDEELNRMFGARVVASVEADLRQERRHDPRRRESVTARHGTRRFIRNFILTEPQPEWSAAESGVSMVHKGATMDGDLFEYVASDTYHSVHEMFVECQDLGDPNALGEFIGRYPFHVESLLAMHDVLMTTGSHLHAEECLNRALFALEAAWHRGFSPVSGNCRLDYEVALNKHLFKALFSHIQYLSRRGCLKTAFECCRFLLGLDMTDPLGTLCMIDYLSIRAGQFDFMENVIERFPDGPALAIRPGIAFSLALCKYKQEKREESMDSLVQAVLMHPLVIDRLMGKLKQTGVRLSGQWESLLQHTFFSKATDGGSASLGHLVNLFVERHHMLYKPQDIVDWLRDGVQIVLKCVDEERTFQGVTASDWTCVKSTAFPQDSRNRFRHLHFYNFSDEESRLPEEALQGDGGGGAIPDIDRRMAEALEQHGGIAGVVRLGEEDLRNANPLVVFLRSLLPWVQTERQNDDHQPNG